VDLFSTNQSQAFMHISINSLVDINKQWQPIYHFKRGLIQRNLQNAESQRATVILQKFSISRSNIKYNQKYNSYLNILMFLSHVCGPSQHHCFILFHALKFNPYIPTNGQINFNCEAKIMFGSSDLTFKIRDILRPSWSLLYGSWIYNCLCNEYLSTLTLWVRIPLMTRCTRYNIMWWSVSVTYGRSLVFSGYSGFLQQ
jgi:hypothetical protein